MLLSLPEHCIAQHRACGCLYVLSVKWCEYHRLCGRRQHFVQMCRNSYSSAHPPSASSPARMASSITIPLATTPVPNPRYSCPRPVPASQPSSSFMTAVVLSPAEDERSVQVAGMGTSLRSSERMRYPVSKTPL